MRQKTPPTPDSVRLKMASLCARSEQCEADIRAKIGRTGISADAEQEIIDFLKEGHFLDNSRFARAFCNDKVRFAAWGRLKIRQGLAAKRISPEAIAMALGEIDEEEYSQSLMRAARSKARSLDLSLREDALKLCRHLASRGYEHQLCLDALRTLRAELRGEGGPR